MVWIGNRRETGCKMDGNRMKMGWKGWKQNGNGMETGWKWDGNGM